MVTCVASLFRRDFLIVRLLARISCVSESRKLSGISSLQYLSTEARE